MITIGLTGNSGCGKSEISRILGELEEPRCLICDCDELAHINMRQDGIAYAELKDSFGSKILAENGDIDRKKLAAIVFKNKLNLYLLNKITHKYINIQIDEYKKKALDEGYDFLIIDAALLIEAGTTEKCDYVWVVLADYEERIKRVIARDGITREQAEERFRNQMTFDEMRRYTSRVIDNNFESLDELRSYMKKLIEEAMHGGGACIV